MVKNENGSENGDFEKYLCELSFLIFGVTGVNALPPGENPVVVVIPLGVVSGSRDPA